MTKLQLFHFLTAIFFLALNIFTFIKSMKIDFKLCGFMFFAVILCLWNLADSIINLGIL